jgi:hypothetical protein
VASSHSQAEPPKSLIQLLGGPPSGAGLRQMYQSRFGLAREERLSTNQGWRSDVSSSAAAAPPRRLHQIEPVGLLGAAAADAGRPAGARAWTLD